MGNADATAALADRLTALTDRFPGKVGYSIRHLETGDVVAHNEQTLFPTASVIKLPLLSAFSAFVEQGNAAWGEPLIAAMAARAFEAWFAPGRDPDDREGSHTP